MFHLKITVARTSVDGKIQGGKKIYLAVLSYFGSGGEKRLVISVKFATATQRDWRL